MLKIKIGVVDLIFQLFFEIHEKIGIDISVIDA